MNDLPPILRATLACTPAAGIVTAALGYAWGTPWALAYFPSSLILCALVARGMIPRSPLSIQFWIMVAIAAVSLIYSIFERQSSP